MKRWMIEKLTGLAGVFGWNLPGWIIRLIPQEDLHALARREQALTDALTRGEPRTPAMPAFLEARIERAILAAEQPGEAASWNSWFLLPATAIAAILAVGIFLFDAVHQPPPVLPETSQPASVAAADPVRLPMQRVVAAIPGLPDGSAASDFLLRPLHREQARLASDVTSALRFVAHSVLPESYLDRVDANLDSLEQEYGNPI